MNRLTLAQRTLLYLYRYRHIPDTIEFGAPREITQDGIAEFLGISRSHASLVVNRLEQEEKVSSGRARINGTDQILRKVYFINPLGVAECERLLNTMDAGLEDINNALQPVNINFCSSAAFWSLPADERNAIGCLMVLRIPVHRSDVDPDRCPMVPFDGKGRLAIKQETKRWYLQRADTETLRQWHSTAADWCSERGRDPKERLYHLFRSNRRREAIKLASSQRYMLMDFPDKESRDILDRLAEGREEDWMHLVTARMSLRLGEVEIAKKELDAFQGDDACAEGAIVSEILLAEGKVAQALAVALDSYIGDIETAAALGICMAANGRYEEALTYLDRCRGEMQRTGCSFRLDEILRTKADALKALGRLKESRDAMEMAMCWGKDPQRC